MTDNQSTPASFAQLIRLVATDSAFSASGPFQANLDDLSETAPLHLVLGDNGSGKSYLVQRLARLAHAQGWSPLQLSMAYRTREGVERQLMYGAEQRQSTGMASLGVLSRAISSMRGWGSNEHVALLDEPDIGLSDQYAYPMGQRIARFALDRPSGTQGVLVVTHSQALVQGLLHDLGNAGYAPSIVLLGKQYTSIGAWLAPRPPATLEALEALEARQAQVRPQLRALACAI